MRNKLLEFLVINNVDYAFKKINQSIIWRNHFVNNVFHDPDEGLIVQDQPWVDYEIKGYS